MKPNTGTVVRVALLAIALINMLLAALGIIPEELVGNDQAYQIGSAIVTAIVAAINAWKNNSFTKEAIQADAYMKHLKSGGTGTEPK